MPVTKNPIQAWTSP